MLQLAHFLACCQENPFMTALVRDGRLTTIPGSLAPYIPIYKNITQPSSANILKIKQEITCIKILSCPFCQTLKRLSKHVPNSCLCKIQHVFTACYIYIYIYIPTQTLSSAESVFSSPDSESLPGG